MWLRWLGTSGRNVSTFGRIGSCLQVVADHVGHERIDALVVGDAGADAVGQRDVAGAVGVDQARHAEHAVGPEGQRVEEIVVDAAIDHVHPLQAARGAHVDAVLIDDQVAALDQLDAHALGEEGVLEVGRVVDAGAQQHHASDRPAARRDVLEHVEQGGRVVVGRRARRTARRAAGRRASAPGGSAACS